MERAGTSIPRCVIVIGFILSLGCAGVESSRLRVENSIPGTNKAKAETALINLMTESSYTLVKRADQEKSFQEMGRLAKRGAVAFVGKWGKSTDFPGGAYAGNGPVGFLKNIPGFQGYAGVVPHAMLFTLQDTPAGLKIESEELIIDWTTMSPYPSWYIIQPDESLKVIEKLKVKLAQE